MSTRDSNRSKCKYEARLKEYVESHQYKEAFQCLTKCRHVKYCTDLTETYKIVLCNYGQILYSEERYTELLKCYEKARKLFPTCEVILSNLGAHLLQLKHPLEALNHFQLSLQCNPSYVIAMRNADSAKAEVVANWHFKMLNDAVRNKAFKAAIIGKVKQKFDRILDIGTGTSLLAQYAIEGGAEVVYACEDNEAMIDICKQVLKQGDVHNCIHLIEKVSWDVEIPDDIPNKVSLVVVELLDYGLLGELILQNVSFAWKHFLLPPYNIIPGVEILNENNQYGLVVPFGAEFYMAGAECLGIAKKLFYPCFNGKKGAFPNLELYAEDKHPYDGARLNCWKTQYLTLAVEIFSVNFNNLEDVETALRGEKNGRIRLDATLDGNLHFVAGWFRANLDERGGSLDTSLASEGTCCWEQAVFPLKKSIPVKAGEEIQFEFSCHNCRIELKEIPEPKGVLSASSQMVCFLNDEYTRNKFHEICMKMPPLSKDSVILDLYPFPLLGFMLLKKYPDCSLWVVVRDNESQMERILKIAANDSNISYKNRLKILPMEEYLSFVPKAEPLFDVIAYPLPCQSGTLDPQNFTDVKLLRKCLKSGGIFYPEEMQVWCRVISSKDIMRGFKVANLGEGDSMQHIQDAINAYAVYEQLELEMDVLEYTSVSEAHILATLTPENWHEAFQLECCLNLSPVGNKKDIHLSAVLCWYREKFGDVLYDTCETECCNQNAFKLDIFCPNSEKLAVEFLYDGGCFRVRYIQNSL